MVNTRTLRDYLASFQPTPNNEGTLVTVNLETVTSAAYLTPGTVAPVALSGDYNDLINLPTLGTAAAADSSDFATTVQGNLADSAVQPIDLSPVAFSGSYSDLTGVPNLGQLAYKDEVSVPSEIDATGTADSTTFLRGDGQWAVPPGGGGGGGQVDSVVEGDGILVDSTDPENPVVSVDDAYFADVALSGQYTDLAGRPVFATVATTGAYSDLTGSPVLATVATTGDYSDLAGKPTLGDLAAKNTITAPTDISATGTPSSSTFLRGDGQWATPPGGGGGQVDSIIEGDGILVDSTDPVNPTVSVDDAYFADVALSGAYADLSGTPTLGSLAAKSTINNADWSGTDLSVANGGTGASDASGARTNLGLAIGTNVQAYSANLASWSSVTRATGFDTFSATPTSANLRALLTDEVGTGAAYFVGGALGTPASVTLTNGTGLPISTGVSGLGAGVATFLATPTSANLAAAVTNETGSGSLVFATSPTLVTPNLGTPSAATLTNATGLPLSTGVTGTLSVSNGGTGATSLTANRVLLGNGTSAVSVLSAGTSGQVLTSNGSSAPTWQALPSSSAGLVPLGPPVIVSTAVAAVDLTLPSGYDSYRIIVEMMTASSGTASCQIRVASTSGVFETTGYRGFVVGGGSSANTVSSTDTNDLSQVSAALNIDVPVNLIIDIVSKTDSTCFIDALYSSATLMNVRRGAFNRIGTTMDKVRFYFSSGNISAGRFQLYGYTAG